MNIPPKGENRQSAVGKLFSVSQKGARKWLEGEGWPTRDNLIAIAKWAGVHIEWLETGRGPKRLEYVKVRPKVQQLTEFGERLSDNKIDQLIKIGYTIAEPDGDSGGDSSDSPHKRKAR